MATEQKQEAYVAPEGAVKSAPAKGGYQGKRSFGGNLAALLDSQAI